MSEVRVNKISPRSGTTVTLGDNGDTISIPSGVTLDASSGGLAGTLTTAAQPNITSVGTLTSFTSTGIDDNATSTAITINNSESVGIGETSPLAKLHVKIGDSGASANAGGNEVVVEDSAGAGISILTGNTSKGQIIFGDDGDDNVGRLVYDHSDNNLASWTNGSERMRIDSSGHLLVGSSSSAGGTNGSALQVKGSLGNTDFTIGLMNSINQLAGRFHLTSSGSNSIAIGADPDDVASGSSLTFEVDGSERMRITSSGNVGIGTTAPTEVLHVVGDILATGGDFKSDANNYLGFSNNTFARFVINDSEKMRINSSGNVGIGTSSPSTKLEVSSSGDTIIKSKATTNNVLGGFEAHNNTGTSYLKVFQLGSAYGGTTFGGVTGNDQALIEAQAATSLVFSTQGGTPDIIFAPARTARMTIKNGGNVGIGTTAPDAKLSVADSKTGTEASSHLSIIGNGYSGHHWLDTSAYYIGQNSNARLLRIYSGSNEAVGVQLGAGGTSFGTYSDERLKKDITDLTNGLNKILALRPVNFKYKSDADDYRNRIGIIAQSIVGQVDEALDETKITADDETQYYNVRYQDLIPVLVKGIQEQQTQIQELEARITTLENA
jgi:hypothetical protein